MECSESQNLMPAYLDGELDAQTAMRCAVHLAGCAACAEASKKMLALHATLSTHAARHAAPTHLRQRIQATLQEQAPRRSKWPKLPWTWLNFGLAGASSVALALSLTLYLAVPSETERLDQEIVADHFRSLMADHLADIPSSDRHTVKPWFTGKLDFSPPVYDLAQQGFPLVGGRLDYLNQRQVAALAYRHRQHLLNLFVWPDKSAANAAVRSTSRQGYQLLHWTRAGMHYWAISDMGVSELSEFKRLLIGEMEKEDITQR
jgi:anti-sigma factor RsiW